MTLNHKHLSHNVLQFATCQFKPDECRKYESIMTINSIYDMNSAIGHVAYIPVFDRVRESWLPSYDN